MSDRQARRQDIARTVYEISTLVGRLIDYQRTDPEAVKDEHTELIGAATALLRVVNNVIEQQLRPRLVHDKEGK